MNKNKMMQNIKVRKNTCTGKKHKTAINYC